MDPKQHQLSKLDPKLKEAYERVMSGIASTQIPSPADGAAISMSDLSPKPVVNEVKAAGPSADPSTMNPEIKHEFPQNNVPSQTTVHEQPVITTIPLEKHEVKTPISASPQSTIPQKVHLGYQSKPQQKIVTPKKKASIPSVVYIMGGLVFFVLYTLFWIKVFNIPLPFLP